MNEGLGGAICPTCGAGLDPVPTAEGIICARCRQRYPLIGDRIPILFREPQKYLTKFAVQLERYLSFREQESEEFRNQVRRGHSRSQLFDAILSAIKENNRLVRNLRDSIVAKITIDDLLALVGDTTATLQYATTLEYLHRDWCWLPEAERELQEIETVLFESVRRHSAGQGAALVLGAGAGRIAWDLCSLVDHVYATDSSLAMAYQFYSLLAGDIVSYSIRTIDVYRSDDMVTRLVASMSAPGAGDHRLERDDSKFSYFVCDALQVPLPAQSASVIASVYFTDLVHLGPLVREISRILQPGGIFIHFGPLDYHFPEVVNHLAAEEIKRIFTINGFKILSEARVTTSHLAVKACMSPRVYENWTFVAAKETGVLDQTRSPLGNDSVLSIRRSVHFKTSGIISAEGEDFFETILELGLGERFGGAGTVLDILRLIDGFRSVGNILEKLAAKYDMSDEAAKLAVFTTLRTLMENGVLTG